MSPIIQQFQNDYLDDLEELRQVFEQREQPWAAGAKPNRDHVRDLLAEARALRAWL